MTTPPPSPQAAFEQWLSGQSPDDPAQAGAAAHWAEYQRLLAVEARVGELERTLRAVRIGLLATAGTQSDQATKTWLKRKIDELITEVPDVA